MARKLKKRILPHKANKVKCWLKITKTTQEGLGNMLSNRAGHYSRQQVSNWLNLRSEINDDIMEQIANKLKIPEELR